MKTAREWAECAWQQCHALKVNAPGCHDDTITDLTDVFKACMAERDAIAEDEGLPRDD